MVQRYAFDFPLQDDYTQIAAIPGAFDAQPGWRDKLAYVFSLSTDHRIATVRLIAIAQAKFLGGLDFRALVWFGNLLCVFTALLVVSRVDALERPWAAAIAAALVFSPTNFVSQYWATGALAHFSVVAYAFAALLCILRRGWAWSFAGGLLAAAAAFTVSNGILVFPVATFALAILGRRRASAVWLLATVALFGWYFSGHAEAGGQQGVVELLQHPLRLAELWMAVLGSIAGRFVPAVVVGTTLVVAWCVLAVVPARRETPREWFAWIAFIALSSAAIAVGRANFGPDAMLNSRYRLYSQLACMITLLALARRLPPRASAVPLAAALPLALAWFVHDWRQTVPNIADLSLHERLALARYALDGHGIYYEFPGRPFGEFALQRARAAGFAPTAPAQSASAFVESDSPLPVEAPIAGLWTIDPDVDASSISVGGFAPPRDQQVSLWLDGSERRYTARLATQRMFWKFDETDPTIFWGACSLAGVAPGRYRAGYAFSANGATRLTWTSASVRID